MEAHIALPTEGHRRITPGPLGVLNDELLANMVKEGNERAFATLYRRYHQALYRYCYSMVRHEADAQDALQSTFMSAMGALRRGQRDAPLRPWLFRIAHNESVSLLRRRRVQDEIPETLPSNGPSVEAAAEKRAQLAALITDLQALPDQQRGALLMRELNGLSHADVAQTLGISVGAAKQTVFEARQALQEFSEGRALPCHEVRRAISDGDRRALRGRRFRAHLRACADCEMFAAAIPERKAALLALAPALPAAAASGLFAHIIRAGAGSHPGGGGGLLAGLTGKGAGAVLSTKALATGAAVIAALGTVSAIELTDNSGKATAKSHFIAHTSRHGSTSVSHHHRHHTRAGSPRDERHRAHHRRSRRHRVAASHPRAHRSRHSTARHPVAHHVVTPRHVVTHSGTHHRSTSSPHIRHLHPTTTPTDPDAEHDGSGGWPGQGLHKGWSDGWPGQGLHKGWSHGQGH